MRMLVVVDVADDCSPAWLEQALKGATEGSDAVRSVVLLSEDETCWMREGIETEREAVWDHGIRDAETADERTDAEEHHANLVALLAKLGD